MGFLGKLFGPNISKLAEKGDIDGIISVLDSGPSVEVQLTSIEALAARPEEKSIAALIHALDADDAVVSDAAESALRGLGASASGALIEALETESGDRALSILLELDAAAIEPLRGALQSPSDAARKRSLEGIQKLDSRLQEPEVREVHFRALLAALGDRSAECRVDAATGLARLADPRAGRALAAQLKDGDDNVRTACSQALGLIGEAATPYLADALADRNANARRLAASLLGEVCAETTDTDTLSLALRALLDHVKDPDPEARERTEHSLRSVPAGTVIEERLGLLADPERSDRDEIHEFLLAVLEHADIPPDQSSEARSRLKALGFDPAQE